MQKNLSLYLSCTVCSILSFRPSVQFDLTAPRLHLKVHSTYFLCLRFSAIVNRTWLHFGQTMRSVCPELGVRLFRLHDCVQDGSNGLRKRRWTSLSHLCFDNASKLHNNPNDNRMYISCLPVRESNRNLFCKSQRACISADT